jgi:hypothetical protein
MSDWTLMSYAHGACTRLSHAKDTAAATRTTAPLSEWAQMMARFTCPSACVTKLGKRGNPLPQTSPCHSYASRLSCPLSSCLHVTFGKIICSTTVVLLELGSSLPTNWIIAGIPHYTHAAGSVHHHSIQPCSSFSPDVFRLRFPTPRPPTI